MRKTGHDNYNSNWRAKSAHWHFRLFDTLTWVSLNHSETQWFGDFSLAWASRVLPDGVWWIFSKKLILAGVTSMVLLILGLKVTQQYPFFYLRIYTNLSQVSYCCIFHFGCGEPTIRLAFSMSDNKADQYSLQKKIPWSHFRNSMINARMPTFFERQRTD